MSGDNSRGWYLQINGERRGPFAAWQLSRYLILQRLNGDHLVSRDGEQWLPLGTLPELQPQRRLAIAALPDEERRHLTGAQAWVDGHPELFPAPASGRREEGAGHLRSAPQRKPRRLTTYLTITLLLLAVLVIPYLIPSAPKLAMPQCEAVAAPGVNWSNCRMRGSRLAGVDLSGATLRNVNLSSADLSGAKLSQSDLAYANLSLSEMAGAGLQGSTFKGANLRNANLRNADLAGADLSYADLTGAILEGANLTGARLGYALWEEGISCMPESVGKCIKARSAP